MSPAALRRADVPVAFTRDAKAHVLVQVSPTIRVLAVSRDRNRLIGEMQVRYAIAKEEGSDARFELAIKDAHVLV